VDSAGCAAWVIAGLPFPLSRLRSADGKTLLKPRGKLQPKTQRPPLYKVILLNDDYTPREFVV